MNMEMPIFSKKSVLRGDMYDTYIEIARNAGWEVHDVPNGHVFRSFGSDGTSLMEFKLQPFDGSVHASYDIRTTDYTNPGITFIRDFDPVAKTFVAQPAATYTMPFLALTSYTYSSARLIVRRDAMVDMHYYATKDVIVMLVVPARHILIAGYYNSLFILGKPSESYLEETASGNYSGWIYATSNAIMSNVAGTVLSMERPKGYVPERTVVSETLQIPSTFLSVNIDGEYGLVTGLYGRPDHGVRGKLSYCYFLGTGGAQDGDIIAVKTDAGVEKYMRFAIPSSTSNYYYSSFGAVSVAIRIE